MGNARQGMDKWSMALSLLDRRYRVTDRDDRSSRFTSYRARYKNAQTELCTFSLIGRPCASKKKKKSQLDRSKLWGGIRLGRVICGCAFLALHQNRIPRVNDAGPWGAGLPWFSIWLVCLLRVCLFVCLFAFWGVSSNCAVLAGWHAESWEDRRHMHVRVASFAFLSGSQDGQRVSIAFSPSWFASLGLCS